MEINTNIPQQKTAVNAENLQGSKDLEYDALLIDTSIFVENGLRLEKGLLEKLTQFKRSPVIFLMPDVIFGEIKTHLEQKIKILRSALEKSINDAADHLFFDEITLINAKSNLLNSTAIEGFAKARLDNFIENTGAVEIVCGEYLNVSSLLKKYFANEAPFSESGKKKNEFPDAIVLMAIENWAKKENKRVLAVSKDDDWVQYCQTSERLIINKELSACLTIFNKANAPYAFLSHLESALEHGQAVSFLNKISNHLEATLDGFTPEQDAESFYCWEPEGSNGQFKEFYLISNNLEIIEIDEEYIVLKASANITVEVEGDFSLSIRDSIDRDYTHVASVTSNVEKEFDSEILITIYGKLDGSIEDLSIEEVEIVSPIKTVHFGTLEIDYSEDD